MKRIFLVFVIMLTSIVVLLYLNHYSCKRLSCIQADTLEKYTMSEVYEETDKVFRGTLSNEGSIIRVEILSGIDESEGRKYINAGIAKMKGLFSDAPAPYPGVISDAVVCDTKYRPLFSKVKSEGNLEISYFTGFLNKRMQFGSCDESQIAYQGILAFFYCSGSNQAYQFELIAPKQEFEVRESEYKELLLTIQCK